MGFILLPLSAILFFIIFFCISADSGSFTKARLAFIYSLLAHAVLIFGYNEIASAFDAVNPVTALSFWIAEVVAVSGILFYLHSREKIDLSLLGELGNVLRLRGWGRTNQVIFLLALIFYIIPLFFLTLYTPPNNFDSHMYHLNRILFWVYNQNLDHFPTRHLQQLYLNVFAEYLVLDTVLLSDSDQFAGLIQFGSFIGSVAGITLLCRHFKMQQNGQLVAAVFMLTLPIGIFESTSTQVDYCACFFFISFVLSGFKLLERRSVLTLSAFLLSLAFGGFAKYTIFIFAIPFTAFFAIRILFQYGFPYALRVLAIAVLLLATVFSPFFYRNYELFGHVMHPLRGTAFATEELPAEKHSPVYTLSGVIKNAGLNLGLPNTGFNRFVDQQIRDFHAQIGVEVDDQGQSADPFSVKYSVHEDMVPNTVHFWLILAATAALFFVKGRWDIKWLWICGVLGFVLFSTLMKFQLWSTRTQMPFFAMGGILVAYIYCEKLRWKPVYFVAPMLLLSSVFVYGNPSKELVSINYEARKALGHIPIAICETGGKQAELYRKYLGEYYQFPGDFNCHPLKKWPDYSERRKVFALLEKVGYYDSDRSSNILGMGRDRAYFLSHPDNYLNFKPLMAHIEKEKNVGLFFDWHIGFYHFWSALSNDFSRPGKMEYIRYHKEFAILKNAQKEFCYDYILTDDPKLLAAFLPKANIDTIYTTQKYQLVKLKKTSCERTLF